MQTVKLIQAEGLRRILVALFYAAAIFVLIYFLRCFIPNVVFYGKNSTHLEKIMLY